MEWIGLGLRSYIFFFFRWARRGGAFKYRFCEDRLYDMGGRGARERNNEYFIFDGYLRVYMYNPKMPSTFFFFGTFLLKVMNVCII